MVRPDYEVMRFGKDVISTSEQCIPEGCSNFDCVNVGCKIECLFTKADCSAMNVYNPGTSIGGGDSASKQNVPQVASPKNIVGFDRTFGS